MTKDKVGGAVSGDAEDEGVAMVGVAARKRGRRTWLPLVNQVGLGSWGLGRTWVVMEAMGAVDAVRDEEEADHHLRHDESRMIQAYDLGDQLYVVSSALRRIDVFDRYQLTCIENLCSGENKNNYTYTKKCGQFAPGSLIRAQRQSTRRCQMNQAGQSVHRHK